MKTIIFETNDVLARRLKLVDKLEEENRKLEKENIELNNKIKSQQRELKRLNNIEKLAKRYAKEVVQEIHSDNVKTIKEQEETIKALREKVSYYRNQINELYGDLNLL